MSNDGRPCGYIINKIVFSNIEQSLSFTQN